MPIESPFFQSKESLKTFINRFLSFYKNPANEANLEAILNLRSEVLKNGKIQFFGKQSLLFFNPKTNENVKHVLVLEFMDFYLSQLNEDERKQLNHRRETKSPEWKKWLENKAKTVERNFLGVNDKYFPLKKLNKKYAVNGIVSPNIPPWLFVQKSLEKLKTEKLEIIAEEKRLKAKAEEVGMTLEEYKKGIGKKEIAKEITEMNYDDWGEVKLFKAFKRETTGNATRWISPQRDFYDWLKSEKNIEKRPLDWTWDDILEYLRANPKIPRYEENPNSFLNTYLYKITGIVRLFLITNPLFRKRRALKGEGLPDKAYIDEDREDHLLEIAYKSTHISAGGGMQWIKERWIWGVQRNHYLSLTEFIAFMEAFEALPINDDIELSDSFETVNILLSKELKEELKFLYIYLWVTGERIGHSKWEGFDGTKGTINIRWEYYDPAKQSFIAYDKGKDAINIIQVFNCIPKKIEIPKGFKRKFMNLIGITWSNVSLTYNKNMYLPDKFNPVLIFNEMRQKHFRRVKITETMLKTNTPLKLYCQHHKSKIGSTVLIPPELKGGFIFENLRKNIALLINLTKYLLTLIEPDEDTQPKKSELLPEMDFRRFKSVYQRIIMTNAKTGSLLWSEATAFHWLHAVRKAHVNLCLISGLSNIDKHQVGWKTPDVMKDHYFDLALTKFTPEELKAKLTSMIKILSDKGFSFSQLGS